MPELQVSWREEEPRECIAKRSLSLYYFERYGWYFSFVLYTLGMAAYLSNAYTASMILLGFAFAISMPLPRSPLAAFASFTIAAVTLVAGVRYVVVTSMTTFTPIVFQPFIASMTAGILVNMAAYAIKQQR